MLEQLPLPFAFDEDFSQQCFHVSESNLDAVRLIQHSLSQPSALALIYGPRGSGKSHLARAVVQQSNITVSLASKLDEQALAQPATTWLIDDLDAIAGWHKKQEILVHRINQIRHTGQGRMLLFAHTYLVEWDMVAQLADFLSRVNGLFKVAEIHAPDDALLRFIFSKLAADHHFALPESVVNFWLVRMPRSYAAAEALIVALDHVTLSRHARIGIPAAKRALAMLEA